VTSEFSGKAALVTGASRGIGAAAAVALARAGVGKFLLQYNSYGPGVEQTVAAVREAGAEALAVQGSLGEAAGVHRFLEQVAGSGMSFDILVNNAGSLVGRAKLPEFTEALYDEVMTLNVKSVWFLTQAVTPGMIQKGAGAVVNLSSIAARNGGGPGATIYAAAKAAVACMTKGLAKELAPKGIRVNAVSPGTVDNHFHEVFSNRQILDNMRAQTPAGTLGTNEEVADTIVFLCSDAARYIHGQTIEINGGMYMV
jgi:3-oxoacyl-[acyl-carrier protein] reductase